MASKRESAKIDISSKKKETLKKGKEYEDEPPAKRKIYSASRESTDDEDSDESGDSSSSTSEDVKEIAVDFKAVPPAKGDRTGIISLLKQTFRCLSIDLDDLANVILEQPNVGCVVILENEDEESDDEESSSSSKSEEALYAVSTIIPLAKYVKDHSAISNLMESLAKKCPSIVTQKMVDDPSSVGLLINERMINIPASIAQHSFPSLKSDLEKAAKTDPAFAKIKKLLLICKTMKPVKAKEEDSQFEFANLEEEFLLKKAISNSYFKVSSDNNEECTLLGGSWNMSDSSSSEDDDDDNDDDGGSKKNEYLPFRHVLLLSVDILSVAPNVLFPGISE